MALPYAHKTFVRSLLRGGLGVVVSQMGEEVGFLE